MKWWKWFRRTETLEALGRDYCINFKSPRALATLKEEEAKMYRSYLPKPTSRLQRFLRSSRDWLYVAGLGLACVAAIAAIIFFFAFFAAIFLGLVGLMVLAWACGAKVTLTKDGKQFGYLRWFTLHLTK